jgi:hypothetical protein
LPCTRPEIVAKRCVSHTGEYRVTLLSEPKGCEQTDVR